MKSHSSPTHRRTIRTAAAGVACTTVAGLGLFVAAPAHATNGPLKYTIANGTFIVGYDTDRPAPRTLPDQRFAGTYSGSFVFDASKCTSAPCPAAYSNISITTSARVVDQYTSYTAKTYTGPAVGKSDASSLFLDTGPTELGLYFKTALGNVGTVAITPGTTPLLSVQAPSKRFTLRGSYEQQQSWRLVKTGTVSTAALQVKTTSLTELPRSGKTTVVRRAAVTPKSAGSIKSIAVRCSTRAGQLAQVRGDIRLCSYNTNLKTGRVTVTTYGHKNVVVRVAIRTKSKSANYKAQTWARTWTVK